MRLSDREIAVIHDVLTRLDPDARVFLFGSRTDDSAAGGDIDLLIESKIIGFAAKIEFLMRLKERIGEQKVDVLVTPSIAASVDPFVLSIRAGAVEI